MRQPGDPSVEDILESIKKVIAQDNRAGAADQRRQRATRGVAAPDAASGQADDVLDLGMSAQFLDADADAGDWAQRVEPASESPLVTAQARTSMRESLAALAVMAQPGAAPQVVRTGETSVEALVRELLRPALADWLDRNLPAMVETMVAAEIARIVGKKV